MNTPAAKSTSKIERPRLLLVYLVLALLSVAIGLFKGLTLREELIAQHPRLEPPMFWIYFAAIPLNLISIGGLWRMRRWGFHLGLFLAAAVMAIDFAVGMPWQHPLAVAVMGVLLLAAVLPRWASFV